MTPATATTWTAAHHAPATHAAPLSGGLLNQVFRVTLADGGAVVLKHAPPYVASDPSIPLDPQRATIEAAALAFVAQRGGPVPRLLAHEGATLLLEDLGDLPHLGAHLQGGGSPAVLDALAAWLRNLHDGPAPDLHNPAIQQARLDLQYAPAAGWLAAAGVPDAAALGARLRALGEELLHPGDCFVMGDLWPPSVLVRPDGSFAVLDWELATVGRRAQDVGHLLAHLDLLAATGGPDLTARFAAAYGPINPDDARQTALHRAAELLTRTIGAFPSPGLPGRARDALVRRAVGLLGR